MKKILLVEDSKSIVMGLEFLLKQEYNLSIAYSKKEAMEKIKLPFDLIILDIMLGDGSGFDIAKVAQNTPILFLSARDDDDSIVSGLDLGEDYLTKPFRNSELVARIKKILSRQQKEQIVYGDVVLDLQSKQLVVHGENKTISSQEFKILELLLRNKNQVLTREKILEHIWDVNENFVNDNTLTVSIKRIRSKLPENFIKTIKGFGYMVNTDEF